MVKFLPSKQAMRVRFPLPALQLNDLIQSVLGGQNLQRNGD